MDPELIKKSLEAANNYGLGFFLSVILVLALITFVAFVLKKLEKVAEANRISTEKREERLAQIIERDLANLKKSVDDHDRRAGEAISRQDECNKRSREEHEKVLTKQDSFGLQQERIASTLKEVSETMHEIRNQK